MADSAKPTTLEIDPSIQLRETQALMQAQIDYLTNRVLVLAQLQANATSDNAALTAQLAEAEELLGAAAAAAATPPEDEH